MIKVRRNVVGVKADFRKSLSCLEGELSANTVMYGVANPLGKDLIITKVIVDFTSPCSASPVSFDCGCAAATITTSNDNLIDGVNIGTPTAANIYNNTDNKGSNGASVRKWNSDKHLTIVASGTPTGIAGKVYIYYREA